jgi:hypothetical protein
VPFAQQSENPLQTCRFLLESFNKFRDNAIAREVLLPNVNLNNFENKIVLSARVGKSEVVLKVRG